MDIFQLASIVRRAPVPRCVCVLNETTTSLNTLTARIKRLLTPSNDHTMKHKVRRSRLLVGLHSSAIAGMAVGNYQAPTAEKTCAKAEEKEEREG
jgi:hypothetical protein